MSRPFPPVWMPGEHGYKEHMDRYMFSYDNISAIKDQTNQLINSLDQQSSNIRESIIGSNEQLASSINYGFSRLSNNMIASNNQIITSINEGFDNLSDITEQGFDNLSFITEYGFNKVTSTIEKLNSDLNYYSGVKIQKLEYQNILLNGILQTLQKPFETQVIEYYKKGCLFVQQEFLRGAIDCFTESISLRMGDYFFPSHFQLGLVYLSGVSEGLSFIDIDKANEYLLKANSIGNREIKTNPPFFKTLADCKFFLSRSFYSKLSNQNNDNDLALINNAIKYCQEAVDLNPTLSNGWYHLAKYRSYRLGQFNQYSNNSEIDEALVCFLKAVEIDRNYLRAVISHDPFYDKALIFIKEPILNLIVQLIELKKNEALVELSRVKNDIKLLEKKDISSSQYKNEFRKLKEIVISSENDFNSNTYFGFDDCISKLCTL